jgi:hypothetical protein
MGLLRIQRGVDATEDHRRATGSREGPDFVAVDQARLESDSGHPHRATLKHSDA